MSKNCVLGQYIKGKKLNLSLYFIKHSVMKTYGEVEI
jgi:hypothetical protein